jgi:hypothetical protein
MAAPMVKKFFEGIKDDIKDDIEPPKKALIVGDESSPADGGNPLEKPDSESEGSSGQSDVKGPLKALPVDPLELERETEGRKETEDTEERMPREPRAERALPVKDGEVIDNNVEEP